MDGEVSECVEGEKVGIVVIICRSGESGPRRDIEILDGRKTRDRFVYIPENGSRSKRDGIGNGKASGIMDHSCVV